MFGNPTDPQLGLWDEEPARQPPAEQTPLNGARAWQEIVAGSDANRAPPRGADERVLARLLLAREWGEPFSPIAAGQADADARLASTLHPAPRQAYIACSS